jgi:predicted nucleic acid-binding protein
VIAYLDASILLRLAFDESGALAEWTRIDAAVTSALTRVECLRTLDRRRVRDVLPPAELALRQATVLRLLDTADVVDVSRSILRWAAQPFPLSLGTLDAIHLGTAMLLRRRVGQEDLTFATHDLELGLAASACGFHVIGT